MNEPKYRRVLLKISGEALAGDAHRGLNFDVSGVSATSSSSASKPVCRWASSSAAAISGRGIKDGGDRMERTRADQMGMLATVINCLCSGRQSGAARR